MQNSTTDSFLFCVEPIQKALTIHRTLEDCYECTNQTFKHTQFLICLSFLHMLVCYSLSHSGTFPHSDEETIL